MIKSYLRGHPIISIDGVWLYEDTREHTIANHRACGHCSKEDRADGHDPCLGELKGLMNACCGHGIVGDAYVQFLDSYSVHGDDAAIILEILKRHHSA